MVFHSSYLPTDRRGTLLLFLRTRLAVSATDEPLEALAEAGLTSAEWLGFPCGAREDPWSEVETWDDGLVLRLDDAARPEVRAKQLKGALSLFDAWALHDGDRLCAEGPQPALVTDYYTRFPGGAFMVGIQLHPNVARPDDVYNRARAALSPSCRPVFHFRNGRIFMCVAGTPPQQFWRRVARDQSAIRHLAVWDRFGNSYYREHEAGELWRYALLDEMSFSP